MNMLMFIGGLILLVIGASALVRGASKLALSFGISPLVVGLTIVAFGTSAPEVAVSVGAVLDGSDDIAIGNVVGSNIFNVLFILGVSALLTPLVVDRQLIRQEVPIVIGLSALVFWMASDLLISFGDGTVLLLAIIAYTLLLYWQGKRAPASEVSDDLLPTGTGFGSRLPGQLVLIVGMFVGRIGILLLLSAIYARRLPSRVGYPQEEVFL
jgi:cation:H+ antiporter